MGCCGWGGDDRTPVVPTTARPDEPRHLVALHRARAEVALSAATSGRPTCRLDGSAHDLESVKRLEGALAAVADLQREMGRAPERAPVELSRELVARWRDERARRVALGPTWIAYQDGGIEALVAVTDDLQRRPAATGTPPA